MALGGQFDAVIKRLTDLTRADKVVWQETASTDTFLTVIGKSVVTVGQHRNLAGASKETPFGACFVRIHDTGQAEAEVSAPEGRAEDWTRIKTLLDLARQSATTQANKVVSDLLSTLEAIR
jgi:hypothetical protein